jgi:hypothetical protein
MERRGEHIYEVSGGQRLEGEGIVTANGLATISQIGFYGLVVPDGGTTLLLFGLALATFSVWKYIAFAYQKRSRMNPVRQTEHFMAGDAATTRSIPAVVFSERKAFCLVYGKIITGREIQVIGDTRGNGPRRIICPMEHCNAMPIDWVQPTDELHRHLDAPKK